MSENEKQNAQGEQAQQQQQMVQAQQQQMVQAILTLGAYVPPAIFGPALLQAAVVLVRSLPSPITREEWIADCTALWDGMIVQRDSGLVVPGGPGR